MKGRRKDKGKVGETVRKGKRKDIGRFRVKIRKGNVKGKEG